MIDDMTTGVDMSEAGILCIITATGSRMVPVPRSARKLFVAVRREGRERDELCCVTSDGEEKFVGYLTDAESVVCRRTLDTCGAPSDKEGLRAFIATVWEEAHASLGLHAQGMVEGFCAGNMRMARASQRAAQSASFAMDMLLDVDQRLAKEPHDQVPHLAHLVSEAMNYGSAEHRAREKHALRAEVEEHLRFVAWWRVGGHPGTDPSPEHLAEFRRGSDPGITRSMRTRDAMEAAVRQKLLELTFPPTTQDVIQALGEMKVMLPDVVVRVTPAKPMPVRVEGGAYEYLPLSHRCCGMPVDPGYVCPDCGRVR